MVIETRQRSTVQQPCGPRADRTAGPGGPGLGPEALEAVRRREPEALGEFFDAYFDRMYGLAYRLLGQHALAEDVLQEVFLKVHRAAPNLDPTRDPGPWLTAVTRNACREHWRRRRRRIDESSRTLDDGSGLGETLTSEDGGPEQDTLRAEEQRVLEDALMRLSPGLREVVVLHDYQGLNHEEIAKVLGTRSATVRKRYSRALARLRRFLRGVAG